MSESQGRLFKIKIMSNYSERKIIVEHVLKDKGCTLLSKSAKYGSFCTLYYLETWSNINNSIISREYSTSKQAFEALESWEKRNNIYEN